MNRPRSETDSQRPLFVEPTSVTVAPEPAARVAATLALSVATGVATIASSASPTAAWSDSAGSSTAPRSAATASDSASESQPITRTAPVRFAARPMEVPISPVPTRPSGSGATSEAKGGRGHGLGEAEREVERLARVQARIAERHVARGKLFLEHGLG